MKSIWLLCLLWLGLITGTAFSATNSQYYSVSYPPSPKEGALQMEADFHMWLPEGVKVIRAIIVHQHGCGDGAENSGERAATDLHWQALARKHDAALVSPHYRAKGANCRLWCDPRNGSGETFVRGLDDLAKKSSHPEIATVPWCLWGHSGGGFWASLMLETHPEKIVAIYCRSGTAMSAWSKGEIPTPRYKPEAFQVPIALNPGIKERGDKQFNGAWLTSTQFFQFFRKEGAPVVFAPDPHSSHDCGNSRLFAIPFFDSCLQLRLPQGGTNLKPLPDQKLHQGIWVTGETRSAEGKQIPEDQSVLPDESAAKAFAEYVNKGITTDFTAPKNSPKIISARRGASEGEVILEWDAEADFESGIRQFAIYRDGNLLTLFPQQPKDFHGFAQFQTLSYHDTPTPNAPVMKFIDSTAPATKIKYAISVINGSGIEGEKSKTVDVR